MKVRIGRSTLLVLVACVSLLVAGFATAGARPSGKASAKAKSSKRGPRGKRGKTGKRGPAGPKGPTGDPGVVGPAAVGGAKIFFRVSGSTPFGTIYDKQSFQLDAACTGGLPELRAKTSADNNGFKAAGIGIGSTVGYVEDDDLDIGDLDTIAPGPLTNDSNQITFSSLNFLGGVSTGVLAVEQAPQGFDCSVTGTANDFA
jgi:hypothetical protein